MSESVKWTVVYDNDVGPDDEGFWEWWTICKNGQPFADAKTEAAANELLAILASHERLVEALNLSATKRLYEACEIALPHLRRANAHGGRCDEAIEKLETALKSVGGI